MAGKRNAQGAGTIRKKTVNRNGKAYTYWEARITTGRDPGTGKQIQQSFTGKTQKEVREKMQAAAVAVNAGTYIPQAKLTVGQWLEIWSSEYLGNLKPGTVTSYTGLIRNQIKPAMGAVRLTDLHPHKVQTFINSLEGLAVNTIRQVYKVLHAALEKAVQLDYIAKNPSDKCVLPKNEQKAIKPLEDAQTAALLTAASGTNIENLLRVALFAGLRVSEILGLSWDQINMEKGTIAVVKQLASNTTRNKGFLFISPKNGKERTMRTAPTVIAALKDQHRRQAEMRLRAGNIWDNPHNLVFTLEDGSFINQQQISKAFKKVLKKAGLDDFRFHDLRHTYAVNAIRAGDDIKTIQGNLGHATAAFTLDRYGHFTEQMMQDSATRMEAFIKHTLNL